MIIGVGVDIIEIERIKKAIENKHFVDRVFTRKEIDYTEKKGEKAQHFAAMFAAKEAVSKVLGTGFSKISFHDIELNHEESGKPFIILSGNARKIAQNLNIEIIHISLSHDRVSAIAYAIGEGRISS